MQNNSFYYNNPDVKEFVDNNLNSETIFAKMLSEKNNITLSYDPSISSACTNGEYIKVNPAFKSLYNRKDLFDKSAELTKWNDIQKIDYDIATRLYIINHGLLIHECLHLIYTDFDPKQFLEIPREHQQLVAQINNIIEDAYIEKAGSEEFIDVKYHLQLLNTLVGLYQNEFQKNHPINYPDGLSECLTILSNKILYPITETKKPSHPDTQKYINAIEDLFYEAIKQPECSIRKEYSIKIYKKIIEKGLKLPQKADIKSIEKSQETSNSYSQKGKRYELESPIPSPSNSKKPSEQNNQNNQNNSDKSESDKEENNNKSSENNLENNNQDKDNSEKNNNSSQTNSNETSSNTEQNNNSENSQSNQNHYNPNNQTPKSNNTLQDNHQDNTQDSNQDNPNISNKELNQEELEELKAYLDYLNENIKESKNNEIKEKASKGEIKKFTTKDVNAAGKKTFHEITWTPEKKYIFPYNEELKLQKNTINRYKNKFAQMIKGKIEAYDGKYLYGQKLNSKKLFDSKKRYWQRKELDYETPEITVQILIDSSGSMKGTNITNARKASIMLHEILEANNISHSIAGFQSFLSVQHNVILPFNHKKNDKYNIMRLNAGGGNRDGLALKWAIKKLLEQKEENKILIVISDGTPSDYNNNEEIKKDFDDVNKLCKKRNIKLIAIALEDYGNYLTESLKILYPTVLTCNNPEKLPLKLAETITELIK